MIYLSVSSHFCLLCRSPFLATNPFGFFVVVIFSLNAGFVYILALTSFTMVYVSVSTNIGCFYDDISMNVDRLNVNIVRGVSTKAELKQFVELQLHCYR